MKASFANTFRALLVASLALSLSSLAYTQHGGGGGHGGGHVGGGRFGGRGHAGAGLRSGSAKPHGIAGHPPFSVVRLFARHHHRHFANGLFVGGFGDCGLWDWNCIWGWDDSYFDFDNWMHPPTGSGLPISGGIASSSPPVTVLYLNGGYSVGVTEYWLENAELHYHTTYGGDNAVPIDELDLQRTINENASRGVPLALRAKQAPPSDR
jgi:hypothetical protein